MASYSWMPILEEIQAYLLSYEVNNELAFDDNVYLGDTNGVNDCPFLVMKWSPSGSSGTNLPQNNLMVDSDEITNITVHYVVENGDNTNAITQELQVRLSNAQKELEIALNKWLCDKLPVEIEDGVFTDWSKKIYFCSLNAIPVTINFVSDGDVYTAVEFNIQFKYNDNNAI